MSLTLSHSHTLTHSHSLPGDLVFNIALGATLVGIPLTIGAIARSAFVRYKFTDKRVSVMTNAPWESECVVTRLVWFSLVQPRMR